MDDATTRHEAGSRQARMAAEELAWVVENRKALVGRISRQIRPILTPEQIRKLDAARAAYDHQGR